MRIFALIILLLLCNNIARAQYTTDEEQAELIYDIADNLRCPTCQGLSVAASQSDISNNMKDKIKQLLDEGKSREDIYDFFETRYGEWILREPRKRSFNWIIWLLPGAIIGLCMAVFSIYIIKKEKVRRNLTEKTESNDDQNFEGPDEDDQIEKDLQKLRRSV